MRPSHTYDRTLVPFDGGWTIVQRMRRGLPVVVHGDGSSLWTLTHHRDFARGGAREIIAWHDQDPVRQRIDHAIDEAMDTLIARYTK